MIAMVRTQRVPLSVNRVQRPGPTGQLLYLYNGGLRLADYIQTDNMGLCLSAHLSGLSGFILLNLEDLNNTLIVWGRA